MAVAVAAAVVAAVLVEVAVVAVVVAVVAVVVVVVVVVLVVVVVVVVIVVEGTAGVEAGEGGRRRSTTVATHMMADATNPKTTRQPTILVFKELEMWCLLLMTLGYGMQARCRILGPSGAGSALRSRRSASSKLRPQYVTCMCICLRVGVCVWNSVTKSQQ